MLLVAVAAPIVGYLGVRIGADILEGLFRSAASSAIEGGVETGPMFDSALVHLVGLCAAFALTVTAAPSAFGARQSTEAWRVGAEGERLTGRALQKLPASYRVRQARQQASAVAERAGATVTPIVCVHGGGVTLEGWSRKSVVEGVRFCSGRQLRKTIAGYPVELGDDAIQEIERRLA